MFDRLEPEAIFLEHLPWINEVAAEVCRKNRMWGDDVDEFISSARAKLMENDYAVIRKFRGDAEVKTYLARVVVLHFMERSRERHGRWRPSAAAEMAGQLAKDLEALVYRDGCTLAEAGERLRTMGRTDQGDTELARLFAMLPMRHPMRPADAGEEISEEIPGPYGSDGRVVEDEEERARGRVLAALNDAMDQLSPDDRVLMRMHLADGRTVADAARALRLDQKALYRRLPRLKSVLRLEMERAGITAAQVQEVLQRGGDDAAE